MLLEEKKKRLDPEREGDIHQFIQGLHYTSQLEIEGHFAVRWNC